MQRFGAARLGQELMSNQHHLERGFFVAVTTENDANGARVQRGDTRQQPNTVDARHSQVGDDGVVRFACQLV